MTAKVFSLYLLVLLATLACAEIVLEKYLPVHVFREGSDSTLARITGWGPTVNKDGGFLCDTPHEFKKSQGKIRILLLGDSILDCNDSGTQPFLGTIPALLADRLGSRYEVINISAGGWGNDQEYLAYQSLGRRYQPDLVLLFFTPANDIFNNASKKAIFQDRDKPYFELEGGKLVLKDPVSRKRTGIFRKLIYKTQLGTRVGILWQRFRKKLETDTLESEENSHLVTFLNPWPEKITRGWEITKAILSEMDAELKKDSARLVVVYVPNGAVVTGAWQGDLLRFDRRCVGYLREEVPVRFAGAEYRLDLFKPYREIKGFCRLSNIPLVDDLEELEPFKFHHTDICYDGLHLSRKGAELLTDAVSKFVEKSG